MDVLDSGSGGIVLRGAIKTQSGMAILGLAVALVCLTSIDTRAQVAGRVRISVSSPDEIAVHAESSVPLRSWSFRNAYAGVLGIAERVEQFRVNDSEGQKIVAGEFRSSFQATRIGYKLRLPRPSAAEVAHATWLTEDHGFLMFSDLLPQEFGTVSAEFILPSGWTVQSAITPDANGHYQVGEPENAVFFVGRSIRKASKKESESFITGTWPFKDSTAVNAAARVMKKYLALTGFRLPVTSAVMIAPLPVATGSTRWRAETRGSTVVLLIDPQARIDNWKGQLEIIFTHELLHLWVPNSLRLQGDYDWFFEGFTLYIALVTALEMKIINFREYLDTLGRVYDSYLSYPENISLLDASERRWTGAGTLVYDKGMLVAFLYDLALRKESGGKATLADRYRELFSLPTTRQADGNEVIIRLLSSTPATADFAKTYIEGSTHLELESELKKLSTHRKLFGHR
jgi:hypothetical protein